MRCCAAGRRSSRRRRQSATCPPADQALAIAIAGETLRRLPDLDALIDSATRQRLPDDARRGWCCAWRSRRRSGSARPTTRWSRPPCRWSTAARGGWSTACSARCFGAACRRSRRRICPKRSSSAGARPGARRWSRPRAARSRSGRRSTSASPTMPTRRPMRAEHGGRVARAAPRPPAKARRSPSLPGFGEGRWWVQDLAASLPARLIPAGAKDVLDLCAAPGGKTMQLAAAGHRVTAVDASESRLGRLRENLGRTHLERRAGRGRRADVAAGARVRRDPARRALLGHRHLPPPSRSALSRPAPDHRRQRRAAGAAARSCRRMAEARRRSGLFGLLARTGGRRGAIVTRLPRRRPDFRSTRTRHGDLPAFVAPRPEPAGSASCPACSRTKAGSTASSSRALSARG